MIKLRDLVKEVNHEAGGNTDARLDPVEIVNEAGYMMTRLHEWDWKRRPSVTLYFVSGQPWVDLPLDFEALISLRTDSEVTRVNHAVSAEKIDQLRGDSTAQGHLDYYTTVVWPWQVSTGDPLKGPRLDIFPTPSETSDSAELRLNYVAGWRPLGRMEEAPAIPEEMRSLLVEYIRAIVRSRVNRTPLTKELDPVVTSETMKAALRGFGKTGGRRGTVRGGAVKLPDRRGPAWIHESDMTWE